MSERHEASDDYVPPLPVGHLRRNTLVEVTLAEQTHHRAGPWVELVGEESRLLRVGSLEELLFETEWSPADVIPRANSHLEAVDRQHQAAEDEATADAAVGDAGDADQPPMKVMPTRFVRPPEARSPQRS